MSITSEKKKEKLFLPKIWGAQEDSERIGATPIPVGGEVLNTKGRIGLKLAKQKGDVNPSED